MLGRGGVVTVEEARRVFYGSFNMPVLQSERLSLMDALGRILAADIVSDTPLPEFARSSMDGYAVSARDTYGATESLPALLKVAGEVLMGEQPDVDVRLGQAVRISTGGMLPPGADAVVMLEDTQALRDGEIEVTRPVSPSENVILAGEDVKPGETLLTQGHKLRPQDIGALAGIGVKSVEVYRRPVVAIINTGNEIVPAEKTPAPGQVRDINSYNLAGLVLQAGGIPERRGIFRDEYAAIREAVEGAIPSADIVALTGGSARTPCCPVRRPCGRPPPSAA